MSHHFPPPPLQEHVVQYPLHPHSSQLHQPHTHPPNPPPQIPLISVSNLPSATTLYASLLQPLSIQFLHNPNPHQLQPPSSTFGFTHLYPAHPLLTLTQSPPHLQIRLAHVILPAPSIQALHKFCIQSEQLIPGTVGRVERTESGERCFVRDFDGNVIEAHWTDQSLGNSSHSLLGPTADELPYHSGDLQEIEYPSQWVEERPRQRERERNREREQEWQGNRRRVQDHDQTREREIGRERERRREGRREKDQVDERGRERRRQRDGRHKGEDHRDRERENEMGPHLPHSSTVAPNNKESQRVLQWQEDVARSLSSPKTGYSPEDSVESAGSVDSLDSEELDNHDEPPQIGVTGYASSDIVYHDRYERNKRMNPTTGVFRRADSDPIGNDKRREYREARAHPKATRKEKVANVKRYHVERRNISPQIASADPSQVRHARSSHIDGATVEIVYDKKNIYSESPPPSVSSNRNPFAPNPLPPNQPVHGNSSRRTRRVGVEQFLPENRSTKLVERERRDDCRDSGIGGMVGINSVERSRTDIATTHTRAFLNDPSPPHQFRRLRKGISRYSMDPETPETGKSRNTFNRRGSREQGREKKLSARSEHQLRILPAAPEPGSNSSESSWSSSSSESESGYESPLKPELGRERWRQKGKSNLSRKVEDIRPQARKYKTKETYRVDLRAAQRDSREQSRSPSRSRNHRSYATKHRYSPASSVISESPSSASGSTLRAEREILNRAPTPPGAVDSRAHKRTIVYQDREPRRINQERKYRDTSERYRSNRRVLDEYTETAAAPIPRRATRDHRRRYQYYGKSSSTSSEDSGSYSSESAVEIPLPSSATDYDDYIVSSTESGSLGSIESRKQRRRRR